MSSDRALATPPSPPWSTRRHAPTDGNSDTRSPYARDRDRLLHCASFRRLQYKTQVYIVSEGDFYRTRMTHTLEVAQVARSLARRLNLDEDLAEAIALAHDVGHTPFGHAGEETLGEVLSKHGVANGWNSNTQSLFLLDELEFDHPAHSGLDLTYATRQGIARHHTPFDRPDDNFDAYPSPTLEAQVVSLADRIAYAGHDVEDALYAGLLDREQVHTGGGEDQAFAAWEDCLGCAEREFADAGLSAAQLWRGRDPEQQRRAYQRARRHFINRMILSADDETRERARAAGVTAFEHAIFHPHPVVACRDKDERHLQQLVAYMLTRVYHSPVVARQNYKERHILTDVFEALSADASGSMLPPFFQERVQRAPDPQKRLLEVARFLASLSDRAVMDLYAELYDPRDRAMGRPSG